MSLSDLAVRRAKAVGKAYTLPDTLGLSLAVTATGGKAWHFRYYWLKQPKPLKHSLIQAVLKLNRGADPWQIYHALLQSRSMLRGRSALEGVTASNLDKLIMAVVTSVKEASGIRRSGWRLRSSRRRPPCADVPYLAHNLGLRAKYGRYHL